MSRTRSTSRRSAPRTCEALGPFVPLAAKLGRLALELADGRADELTLAYYGGLSGYDTRLLTVAALNGAFQGPLGHPVNYVNAPLIAAERGIEVREERRRASARLHQPRARGRSLERGRGSRRAGRRLGKTTATGCVSALGFELEIELAPLLVFFRYDDVPGVIGRLGIAVRRGGRQHRQHGGLALAPRGQGADGALDRFAAAGEPRSTTCLRRASSTTPTSSRFADKSPFHNEAH